MKKLLQKGFTLIELLIVIGILGILVVAVLLTLNPAEAQKKARDSKRLKDLATLQTIVDQYINDGGTITTTIVRSNGGVQSCSAGWLGINVCQYTNSLPLDPINKLAAVKVAGVASAGSCTSATTVNSADSVYRVQFSATTNEYEVDVRQESNSNCKNINGDGGNAGDWVEAGSDLTLSTFGN